MNKISVIVLTKNEEEVIANCLNSVSFCDEVVVIDSMSTDKTVEIAKRMNAKVYESSFAEFSQMRNFGKEKSSGEWILYIDADELVTGQLQDEIKEIIKSGGKDAYILLRKNYYLGNFAWPKLDRMPRLFKKTALLRWEGKLHETPIVKGDVGILHSHLLHYTHRNLAYMLEKTNVWSETEARLRFDAHHPCMVWWRFPRVMMTAFLNSYIGQSGWKMGTAGLVESIYQSFSMFVTYAKLWEMQKTTK
jgi:glycosyltransferase involved in cell wall biosynthesis